MVPFQAIQKEYQNHRKNAIRPTTHGLEKNRLRHQTRRVRSSVIILMETSDVHIYIKYRLSKGI